MTAHFDPVTGGWPRTARSRRAIAAGPIPVRALGAIVVLAAVLRFYRLGHQGFWYDEADTALLMKFSAGQMLGLIPHTESTPPLYYCVAWVWTRVFGDTETGLRSLSAVCGVLLVPVAFATARLLMGRRAAVIAALLTACNPLLIWYSQEARAYEMVALLCGLSLLGCVWALDDRRPRALALWVIASLLALTTHFYASIVIVPEAVILLWSQRQRATLIAIAVVAAGGAALVPLAIEQTNTGNDAWIANASLGLRLAQIIPQFLIGTGTPARTPLKFAAFALALIALGLLCWRARWPARGRGLLAGGVAGAGFVISLAFISAGSDTLITRNLIVLWLPAALAVSGGLAAVSEPGTGARLRSERFVSMRGSDRSGPGAWVAAVITAGLCAIGLVATVGVARDANLQRPDWRPVAAALGAAPTTGARLVLLQNDQVRLPLALYVPELEYLRAPAAAGVGVIDVIAIRSPQQPLCWWGAACNLIPSQMQARYRIAGFHEQWRRRIEQFTVMQLVADRPRTVTRTALSAALHSTTLDHDRLLIQRSAGG